MALMLLQARAAQPRPAVVQPAPQEPAEAVEGGEVVVRVRTRRRAAVAARTEAAVARQLPGTQGDAVRVVESLPGVGRPSFGTGELVVWGAAPEQSRVYVDGVPVPALFHVSGLRSVLNGFFVGNIELTPGAYGVEYGRALAGMVQIETAPMRSAGFHGYASVDLLDGSTAMSVAPTQNVSVGGGFRYGWIDRLAQRVVSPSALQYLSIPQYYDWQLRAEWRPSEYSRLVAFGFGSFDAVSNHFTGDDPTRARGLDRERDFQRVVVRYTSRLEDGARLSLQAWGGHDQNTQSQSVGPYTSSLSVSSALGGVRASWLRTMHPSVRLNLGVDAEFGFYDLQRNGSLLRPPREGDVTVFGQPPTPDVSADRWGVRQVQLSPYVELPLSFFDDRLSIVPGFRLEGALVDVTRRFPQVGDQPTWGAASLDVSPEPRLSIAGRLTSWLSVRATGGLYSAAPRPEDLSAVFGTPTLGRTRSAQGVLGATVNFSRWISLEMVGFVRHLWGLAERADPTQLRVANALVNSGTAMAYGGQITLRHALANNFTGWLSYTLSRSEVSNAPGQSARLSDYDQTHLLTAVGSLQLPLGFSVGARFRLLSGLPRTPVVGRYYDALTGDYQPVFGAVNSTRLPVITSADVRVDKRFRAGPMELVVFLDVLNVLNRPVAEEIVWDPTFTQQGNLTGLPILADLGLRGEW